MGILSQEYAGRIRKIEETKGDMHKDGKAESMRTPDSHPTSMQTNTVHAARLVARKHTTNQRVERNHYPHNSPIPEQVCSGNEESGGRRRKPALPNRARSIDQDPDTSNAVPHAGDTRTPPTSTPAGKLCYSLYKGVGGT